MKIKLTPYIEVTTMWVEVEHLVIIMYNKPKMAYSRDAFTRE